MTKTEEKVFMVIALLVLVLGVIGISYAAFSYSRTGEKVNTINTGILSMSYEETSNVISMNKSLPTTDATGKVRLKAGEYFDFSVSSTIQGNAMINWEIAAEDLASNTFDGRNVRLYLTKVGSDGKETEVMAPKNFTKKTMENKKTGRPANMMSLAVGTMSASEVTKYRLRMYVDERYNPQGDGGNKVFAIKINVYGKIYEEPVGSKLKAYTTDDTTPQTDFHANAYRVNTTSIVTKKDNIVPSTAIESWDLSEAGDGGVMAYAEDDGSGDGTYKVTIGGKDGIIANESMRRYFYMFSILESIDLSALDTSNVTDMNAMFLGHLLTNLDLSNFDTSNVTDMGNMFSSSGYIESLDLSSFDTSKVTNMNGMFFFSGYLINLDLSSFDTSNVVDMNNMFRACSELTGLDVSNFDTSSVINMAGMFASCSNLTNLNLSSFDTSKVTDMNSMFSYCSNVTEIRVSNNLWVVGDSTNVLNMFKSCGTQSVTFV